MITRPSLYHIMVEVHLQEARVRRQSVHVNVVCRWSLAGLYKIDPGSTSWGPQIVNYDKHIR